MQAMELNRILKGCVHQLTHSGNLNSSGVAFDVVAAEVAYVQCHTQSLTRASQE
jgi:hypothetical protein